MSNLTTYCSFNVPDVNLNNQIQNWADGIVLTIPYIIIQT